MKNLFEFYKTLSPGDVITTVGVQEKVKGDEITHNRLHHQGWGQYARVTDAPVADSEMKMKDCDAGCIGVKWEGIDPSVKDVIVHVANPNDTTPTPLRKANRTERKLFLKEYVKTRVEIVDHMTEQVRAEEKKLRAQRNSLKKIAAADKIDLDKLLKDKKK